VSGQSRPSVCVAGNLAAVTEAVADATSPLSIAALRRWHRTLMTGSPTPGRYVGELRDEQGWIGGTSPFDAALVTPPPERLPELVDDLVDYANRDDVDPVAQAAICHAQFEVIHPFADGNGRVGRVLISWIMTRRLALVTPPPVSARMASDVGGYLAGLTLFRLGQHQPWITWFANAVIGAGESQRSLVRRVDELRHEWRERLEAPRPGRAIRSDSSAWRVLDLLPSNLVLTSDRIADQTGLTRRAVNNALHTLADAGVVSEHGVMPPTGRGRPTRLYVSEELLALAGSTPLRPRA
jgi:Fic family protein